ncbi:MAG: lipopolysaccharide biosynthesis protein [Bacteroides sp.]|nr:lipopolysaccharide biosynthesis protein [Bacteroides sp.]
MSDKLGNKAIKGTVWSGVDRIGNMCLQFGVNLILARLLLPSDFGAIGMIEIFIVVSQVLIDGGFTSSLIQKKTPTQADYSTIFLWNLIVSAVLYTILFICAPIIASFYDLPELKAIIRVLGLVLITISLSVVHVVRLRKQLELNKLACANLSAYMIAGIFSIIAAWHGFGVWSLVIMQLSQSAALAVILWMITRWTPSFTMSRRSLNELFRFGGYLLAASLLQEICKNIQGLIIGKRFSATAMGLYSQAYKLDRISSYTLPNILVQVMYPVYASVQDENDRLANILGMNTRLISFVIFPLMAILILIAEPLMVFLYGVKWAPCAPYFQILCVGGLFICLQNTNFYAVAAKGKSNVLFYWSIYKWSSLLIFLLIGMFFGIYGLLWGMGLSNFNIFMVNALLASRYTDYKFLRQIMDILPIFILSAATMGITYMIASAVSIHFIVIVLIYISIYFSLACIFHLQAIGEIKTVMLRLTNRNK